MVDLVAPARGNWLVPLVQDLWAQVGGVAGRGFPAYVRILHPVPAQRDDLSATDEWGIHPTAEETRWRWADVAARTGGTMHRLVQWMAMTGHDFSDRIRFENGWTVTSPEQGYFDPDLLAGLTEDLRPPTNTPDDLVAGIWDGWGELHRGSAIYSSFQRPAVAHGNVETESPSHRKQEPASAPDSSDPEEIARRCRGASLRHARQQALRRKTARRRGLPAPDVHTAADQGPVLELPGRDYILFATDLDTLGDPTWPTRADIGWDDGGIGLPVSGPMPQLIWPEDHAWVLASEIDWDSTILAGPRDLVGAVLADDRFETFEVDVDDSLAWESDTVNGA
jgi:hypothetical protein